jgi:predicted nucleotide-binding protein
MARRPKEPEPASASLSAHEMRQGIERLQRRIAELEAFDPRSVQKRWSPEVEALQAAIDEALGRTFGHGTVQYNRYSSAAQLDSAPVIMGGGDSHISEVHRYLTEDKARSLALLKQAVRGLQEDLADSGGTADRESIPASEGKRAAADEVFIVHGQDTAAKAELARFIEHAGLKPVILHEQPNAGRTIIEKFEHHGGSAGFAVVLLTPDDVGGPDADHLQPRARQNVIGEMFWFAGKLGRDHVCALMKGHVEIPSDFAGVVYTEMDDRGAWKTELLRELNAAGYEINWKNALS